MSEMGDDFNAFHAAKKVRNRESLASFDPTGWERMSDQHYRRVVNKVRFDYWPSTGTVGWRNKYYRGVRPDTIEGFIRNRSDT